MVAAIDAYKLGVAKALVKLDPERLFAVAAGARDTGLGGTLLVSIKIDGIGVFVVFNRRVVAGTGGGSATAHLCNTPYHRVWFGLPAITELEALLAAPLPPVESLILARELVAARTPGLVDDDLGFASPGDSGEAPDPASFDARSRVGDVMRCQTAPNGDGDLYLKMVKELRNLVRSAIAFTWLADS